MKKFIFLSLMIFPFIWKSAAQIKYEKEIKINAEDVPKKAYKFIDLCFEETKRKWFKEIRISDISYEVKLTKNKKKYSIEFDSTGTLEDVEIDIKFKSLEESLRSNIEKNTAAEFTKYHIRKSQLQWSGNEAAIEELLRKGETSKDYTVCYEIVMQAKKDKVIKLYEILFDYKGKILLTSEIKERPTDNMIF